VLRLITAIPSLKRVVGAQGWRVAFVVVSEASPVVVPAKAGTHTPQQW